MVGGASIAGHREARQLLALPPDHDTHASRQTSVALSSITWDEVLASPRYTPMSWNTGSSFIPSALPQLNTNLETLCNSFTPSAP
eukprot:CAMPEP_0180225116 /NCGR_PEP_ID=MMETSP0987-20121128/22514_1 /TAXON_ID=697907 /ORGANISM="non described non described, Strain CCMP2293" /LENGTH=84 /DNA_ID=CAMNT_0022188133 /DNA_START=437 /DNA_END=689 /DNA_ORIENTATION=-